MKLEEFYRQAGGSYEDVHARFQSDERVLRFLRLFAGDGSMDSLTAAVERNDPEGAFRGSHTLKGVALNLGLTALAAASSDLTEALRGKAVLPERALYERVLLEYRRVRAALDELEA